MWAGVVFVILAGVTACRGDEYSALEKSAYPYNNYYESYHEDEDGDLYDSYPNGASDSNSSDNLVMSPSDCQVIALESEPKARTSDFSDSYVDTEPTLMLTKMNTFTRIRRFGESEDIRNKTTDSEKIKFAKDALKDMFYGRNSYNLTRTASQKERNTRTAYQKESDEYQHSTVELKDSDEYQHSTTDPKESDDSQHSTTDSNESDEYQQSTTDPKESDEYQHSTTDPKESEEYQHQAAYPKASDDDRYTSASTIYIDNNPTTIIEMDSTTDTLSDTDLDTKEPNATRTSLMTTLTHAALRERKTTCSEYYDFEREELTKSCYFLSSTTTTKTTPKVTRASVKRPPRSSTSRTYRTGSTKKTRASRLDWDKVNITRPVDINAILAIIANLTYDYDWNLTEEFNRTLIEVGTPTCMPPTTTSTTPTPEPPYDLKNTSLVEKCFVCGLKDEAIPHNAFCADAFAGDFLPLMPVDPRARGQIAKFRKYCRHLDIHNYYEDQSEPRSIYGRFTGGCGVRWTDLSGVYTQRTCRSRFRPLMGKHFASKRMAKLEMALINVENGCIISPMATLVPLSRGISLHARFHACVCTGSWCNRAEKTGQWKSYTTILWFWLTTRI